MKHARRMMVCRIGRGSAPPPEDLLIDDCETAWASTTGLLRTVNATPTAGGSGYTAGDILDVTTGGAGGKVQVSTVDGGGAVTALVAAAYAGGYGGYTTGTGNATTGGTGTGCTVNITAVAASTVSRQSINPHDGTYHVRTLMGATLPARALLGHSPIAPGSLAVYARLKFWWFAAAAANFADDALRLSLCSDSVGRVVVDDFAFPAFVGTGAYVEFDLARVGAGQLAFSGGSIALYRGSAASVPTATTYLDTIRVSTGLP